MDNFMFQKLMNVKKEDLEESNVNELASHGVEVLDVSNDDEKQFKEKRQEKSEGYSARKNQE